MKASFTVSCWHYDIHWHEATYTYVQRVPDKLTMHTPWGTHIPSLPAQPVSPWLRLARPIFTMLSWALCPRSFHCHFPLCLEYFWGFLVKLYLFSYAQV